MTSTLSIRHGGQPARRPTLPALPAAGPAWFGALMGTSILGTLSHSVAPAALQAPAQTFGRALLVIGWVLLLVLTAASTRRVVRHGSAVFADWMRPAQLPFWGMVSMGVLALGSTTVTVLPPWFPSLTGLAWSADAVLWVLGTVLGLATAIGFSAVLVRSDLGTPTTVWGLALVPPMVSATCGAALVPHLSSVTQQVSMILATVVCFVVALALGGIVFAIAYHHHWRVAALPVAASASAWIPLGVVGQSTAAAQAIAHQTELLVPGPLGAAVQNLANVYGYLMLGIGVPLVAWAVVTTIRGFVRRMPFAPGWWALTFPIGTMSLGSHLLGAGSGLEFFSAVGVAWWLVLCCTWTLCAVATITALWRRSAHAQAVVTSI